MTTDMGNVNSTVQWNNTSWCHEFSSFKNYTLFFYV
jgi:hypothetical protein